MQLQRIHDSLVAADVALYAVSYDSVDTVARFAAAQGIDFPLLADEWGPNIGRLGLTDPNMRKHHARYATMPLSYYRGVALPGVFVLDENGVVADKRFHANRMERDAPATLLEEALAIAVPAPGTPLEAMAESVRARAFLDSPDYQRWQRHLLTVDIDIDDGWHVYAAATEPPYQGLGLAIESPEGVTAEEPRWPPPRMYRVAGLDEEMMVHTTNARITVPITFGVERGRGSVEIILTLRYQACSATDCLAPDALVFELAVDEAERVS